MIMIHEHKHHGQWTVDHGKQTNTELKDLLNALFKSHVRFKYKLVPHSGN